jgi:hypothetical protein
LFSCVIFIGSIAKALGMPRNKAPEEPNVNEARENIKKMKEMAKSKAVEGAKRAPENTTKGKTPPSSPNAKVSTPQPTPEGTLSHECVFVYLHYYALCHRYSYIVMHN